MPRRPRERLRCRSRTGVFEPGHSEPVHQLIDQALRHAEQAEGAARVLRELRADITDEQGADWLGSNLVDWANESFAIVIICR
jgi:hypothetical protein